MGETAQLVEGDSHGVGEALGIKACPCVLCTVLSSSWPPI